MYIDATEFVSNLSRIDRIELVMECLNRATAKAQKTNDPIHWVVVEEWERRLIEEIKACQTCGKTDCLGDYTHFE